MFDLYPSKIGVFSRFLPITLLNNLSSTKPKTEKSENFEKAGIAILSLTNTAVFPNSEAVRWEGAVGRTCVCPIATPRRVPRQSRNCRT